MHQRVGRFRYGSIENGMEKSRKHRRILWGIAAVLVLLFTVQGFWENSALSCNRVTVASSVLPDTFSGFRIAHVSDLHNAQMGHDNANLLSILREEAPDIIAITGDLIDSRRTDTETAIRFVTAASAIAPCYYVTGNHESRINPDAYDTFETQLENAGATVLHDEAVLLERGDEAIVLAGIDDPDFAKETERGIGLTMDPAAIQALFPEEIFSMLLSHRPEYFPTYSAAGVHLVLSGHAHGGQIRLPLLGGLFVPSQGFFPRYDAGLFTEGDSHMVVSRGIGNSLFPFRLNNRPEVVLIELLSA